MSNWPKFLQYLQNMIDEIPHKTIASEDLFFLYSQRQLEKNALQLLDSESIQFIELWWVIIYCAQSLLNLAFWCYKTWKKRRFLLFYCAFFAAVLKDDSQKLLANLDCGERLWKQHRAGEMPQPVKELASKTDDLSLIPGTHVVEGKKRLPPSCTLVMCHGICACPK